MSTDSAIAPAPVAFEAPEQTEKHDEAQLEDPDKDIVKDVIYGDKSNTAGLAHMRQREVIPSSGKRMPTSKWEYFWFCIFYFSNNGAPINTNGGVLRQALASQANPSGYLHWGGKYLPLNSMLLDITGILFAAQVVTLIMVGSYADYGNWRPWIMIFFQSIVYICQFVMCGLSKPSQWQVAQAIYLLGSLGSNMTTAFYQATYPSLVRDLPKMIESEQAVFRGEKTPQEHEALDGYERSKLYNLVNMTGSLLVIIMSGVAMGISAKIGYDTNQKLIHSYQVIMGFLGAVTVICTVPFFIVQKHRPGQQVPKGTRIWLLGPKQVVSAIKSAAKLKHCMLYLIAYFLIHEASDTTGNVTGILQSEIIHYSPLINNAFGLISDLCGGSGTLACFLLQRKVKFSIRSATLYGAVMTLMPTLWGAIGYGTKAVGFHHSWEFWLASAWNFQNAPWALYGITMISEVSPTPKAYMFFALFNTVSKTSGFIGPFISSAITDRAHGNTNASYLFLLPVGLIGLAILWFVDPEQAKIDNAAFLEREAQELYAEEQRREAANSAAMEHAGGPSVPVVSRV